MLQLIFGPNEFKFGLFQLIFALHVGSMVRIYPGQQTKATIFRMRAFSYRKTVKSAIFLFFKTSKPLYYQGF